MMWLLQSLFNWTVAMSFRRVISGIWEWQTPQFVHPSNFMKEGSAISSIMLFPQHL